MAEQTDQIITFDDKEFKYSELTDHGKVVVNQLNIIEQEIGSTKMLLDRHEAAKKTFVDVFKEIINRKEEE
jgi:hypothetical protein